MANLLVGAVVAAMGIAAPAIAQQTVWLGDNEETSVTGYFLEGEDIYASCDEDCLDVNLFLFNEMGVLIDGDEETDAFPIVTAPYEGTFVVKVNMPSCQHAAGCSVSIESDYGF